MSTSFWKTSLCGPGLLITVCGARSHHRQSACRANPAQAKGYPDLITRTFVNLLCSTRPDVPVVVLADFDPDGLNIFRCYWPDTESPAPSSARPNGLGLRLLGIKSDHVIDLQASDSRPALTNQVSAFDFQSSSASTQHSASAISTSGRYPAQTLSSRDRKHVRGTLSRVVERGGSDAEVVSLTRELQVMLMMGIKAEIQLLEDSGDLTQWLENNLTRLLSP